MLPGLLGTAGLAGGYLAAYIFLDWASSMHALQGLAITPWNPPAGLSLAFLLVYGPRLAPLLIVAALAGDIVIRRLPGPIEAALLAALAPAVGYVVTAFFLRRMIGFDRRLSSVRDLAALIVAGALGSAAVAAGVVASYAAPGVLAADRIGDAMLRYWIGDFIGIAVLAPFLLRLSAFRWRSGRVREMSAQAIALLATWWFVFEVELTDNFKFFFVFFIPVMWITLRHGLSGATIGCLAVQIALIYSTTAMGIDARTVIELQALMLTLTIVSQFTGVVVDERRAQEAARGALQDQIGHLGRLTLSGEIASGVAHELNQPLTAVVNYIRAVLNLFAKVDVPAEARVALEKAEAQALHAGESLRRLRDFMRRGELHLSTVAASEAIDDAVALMLHAAEQANVRIVVNQPPQPLAAIADRVQIVQVLVNLMRNALDSLSAARSSDSRIDVGAEAVPAGRIEFYVADTGSGVPPELRGKMFETFFTTKPTGMGMGLAICRTLIEAQDGHIWYVPPSAAGAGQFRFSLPAAASEES